MYSTREVRCDKCNKPVSMRVINFWETRRIDLCERHAQEFKSLKTEEKKAYFRNCF